MLYYRAYPAIVAGRHGIDKLLVFIYDTIPRNSQVLFTLPTYPWRKGVTFMADSAPSRRSFCYIARYDTGDGEAILCVLYSGSTDECASILGLDPCWEVDCDERAHGPHAHVPESRFGSPQAYPIEDVRRAGLVFRTANLARLRESIRWELWQEGDVRRAVRFERVPFLI